MRATVHNKVSEQRLWHLCSMKVHAWQSYLKQLSLRLVFDLMIFEIHFRNRLLHVLHVHSCTSLSKPFHFIGSAQVLFRGVKPGIRTFFCEQISGSLGLKNRINCFSSNDLELSQTKTKIIRPETSDRFL